MIGIEARDLRKGDRIVGVGTVAGAPRRDRDGDITVRLDPAEPYELLSYHPGAWLRVERPECQCHNELGSHELCCGHDEGRNPDCPIHGDGS